jgi:hypothetical protein
VEISRSFCLGFFFSLFIKANHKKKMPASPVAIPVSTHVEQSRVVPYAPDRVWSTLRPLTFSWLKSVKEVKADGNEGSPQSTQLTPVVGSTRRVVYTDGTVQSIKMLELSDLHYFVTYEVIASEPAVSVTSAVHTLRLRHITFDKCVGVLV